MICMYMGINYAADGEPVFIGDVQILVTITLRINDKYPAVLLAPDYIRKATQPFHCNLLKKHIIIYASVSNLLGSEQEFGYQYASIPDEEGVFRGAPIGPAAKRWILVGCFITLSKDRNLNQLDKIN